MISEAQKTCFFITLVGAIVATLVYVYVIVPNIKPTIANYSPRKPYPTTIIKRSMVNRMPHGLSTSDNRDVFKKESCCGM